MKTFPVEVRFIAVYDDFLIIWNTDGLLGSINSTTEFWRNGTAGSVVAAAAVYNAGSVFVCGLRHVGSLSRHALPIWSLPLAFLLSAFVRRFSTQLVGCQTELDTIMGFAGVVDSLGSGRFSINLLLLPWCLLQIILG